MSSHLSLVIFTLLVQSAVGSLWCTEAALLLGGSRFALFHYEWHVLSALLVVLAGLGASMAHLGRLGACFYALRNLKSSWLSREIVATGAFAGILAIAVLTCTWSGASSGWVLFAGSLIGGFVLYAMARAYRLRTVPSWNHAGTLLGFLGSALLLGGLQFTLVSNVPTAGFGTGYDISNPDFSRHIGLLAALAGLMFKVQAQGEHRPQTANYGALFSFSQPILQGSGIVLWALSIMFKDSVGLQWTFLSPVAVGLVAGEIIHRVRFYYIYHRVGL